MNTQKTRKLSRYLAALRSHLRRRHARRGRPTPGIGREFASAGLKALDLARMHEASLMALAATHDFGDSRNGLMKRAGNFFADALLPIMDQHRGTGASFQRLQQRAETLRLHAAALAEGNRQLNREVKRRKAGEAAVEKAKEHYRCLFLESEVMQKKLQRLTRQILSAQEDERREISRELHGEVVQTLVGINVQLATLGKAASLGIRGLKAKIDLTQRLVARSVNAVHQFARELRPAVLDDLGLIPALHASMKTMAARRNLKVRLTASAAVEALDAPLRTVLYRVAQEALTNVTRHARARHVDLTIVEVAGGIRLDVHDDGKGFAVQKTLSSRANRRLGLLGMRERVEMVGGTLTIESSPGRGTTVRAEVPFNPKEGA
ncbi:sensor histidine kinase [Opitutus terrae]|uniref:Oxygen sensor histidine kinase NreB n=1 Tax=Opitutus terrae (strain DSM 11246 / JCM 15787 / PB90-1) TaxID=452637 RepID=B1ZPK4_OPITP|nr:ATP-binding protein [Opitutus terrae]ACB74523.1 histidine kinase [Opitutus terrae PB90-1]